MKKEQNGRQPPLQMKTFSQSERWFWRIAIDEVAYALNISRMVLPIKSSTTNSVFIKSAHGGYQESLFQNTSCYTFISLFHCLYNETSFTCVLSFVWAAEGCLARSPLCHRCAKCVSLLH
ncbi:hypothetical protein CDAR_570961 [Caerostris darwini]|uniref:Uncharacterized protein n=1 Tax=Caerostris darwini TaxID=1538125 RepID=A0AAV4P5Z4_9ARAC|nr:hypothetical protein CDAR_570961 [Caerostris darwini]